MSKKHWKIQLVDTKGRLVQSSGGQAYVADNGDYPKVAVATSADGTAATSNNPVSLTNGMIEFWTATTVNSIDLYVQCPGGEFVVEKDIDASGPNEIVVPGGKLHVMQIPFSIDDTDAATETDTGFDTGTNRVFLPHPVIDVGTLDASMTIDVGTDGSGSNDPNGFLDGISLTTATKVMGTLTNGAATLGVLFSVQDSSNSGDLVPEAHFNATSENITYTLSSSTDTGEGIINLPYMICE